MTAKIKKPLTEKDAKDTENLFMALSIGCLLLALVFTAYDGIYGKGEIKVEDYVLVLFGMISFTMAIALSNKIRLDILMKK